MSRHVILGHSSMQSNEGVIGFLVELKPLNSTIFTFDTKIQKWKTKFNPENYKSKNFSEEVVDAKTGKTVIKLGEKVNYLNAKSQPMMV